MSRTQHSELVKKGDSTAVFSTFNIPCNYGLHNIKSHWGPSKHPEIGNKAGNKARMSYEERIRTVGLFSMEEATM